MNGYLKFIQKKWGVEGLAQCKKDVGIEDMEFRDGQYYQDAIIGNVLRWVHREKGRDAILDAGRFIMHNLGILSWLVRFTDIETLAKRFPKDYSEVYAFGKCTVDLSDPARLKLILKDVGYYEEACMIWEGVIEEALTMTKTKGSVKHTKCQRLGESHCEFIITVY
ncbi:MAG: hypothetical protein KKH79_04225 [Candidatus Thermoplasmatota archaeon]|nr:hypothetical protein [Candidatus Thermoplasmatota archaeon]